MGEVRIIGGLWRRSKLAVPDQPGLRPTPDRVRETLFNWLGQNLSGWRVLDAFAGSGALGLEAASRGAAQVTLLERDPQLVASLKSCLARLNKDGAAQVRIEQADAVGQAVAFEDGQPGAPRRVAGADQQRATGWPEMRFGQGREHRTALAAEFGALGLQFDFATDSGDDAADLGSDADVGDAETLMEEVEQFLRDQDGR